MSVYRLFSSQKREKTYLVYDKKVRISKNFSHYFHFTFNFSIGFCSNSIMYVFFALTAESSYFTFKDIRWNRNPKNEWF